MVYFETWQIITISVLTFFVVLYVLWKKWLKDVLEANFSWPPK